MERQLRDNIGFPGTPLRLIWKGKPPSKEGEKRRLADAARASEDGPPSRRMGSRGRSARTDQR